MDNSIEERVICLSNIFLSNCATVREVAKLTGYSKSTVHKDLNERLYYINEDLYQKVRELLDYNKGVRHIRGGLATKRKYIQ